MSPKAEQYFGVTTKAFVNDGALNGPFIICDNTERYAVYNVVDDYFADSIDLLERELLKQVRSKNELSSHSAKSSFQAGEAGKEQVKIGCDNILKVIRKLCDRNFDKFEVYLSRNIFHIPKEITLEQLNKERAKAYREDAKSIVSLEKDELEVEKAILQAQRELASLTSETAHLSAIVNANKTQIERTAQAIEEAKRHNSVNRQTCKLVIANSRHSSDLSVYYASEKYRARWLHS